MRLAIMTQSMLKAALRVTLLPISSVLIPHSITRGILFYSTNTFSTTKCSQIIHTVIFKLQFSVKLHFKILKNQSKFD